MGNCIGRKSRTRNKHQGYSSSNNQLGTTQILPSSSAEQISIRLFDVKNVGQCSSSLTINDRFIFTPSSPDQEKFQSNNIVRDLSENHIVQSIRSITNEEDISMGYLFSKEKVQEVPIITKEIISGKIIRRQNLFLLFLLKNHLMSHHHHPFRIHHFLHLLAIQHHFLLKINLFFHPRLLHPLISILFSPLISIINLLTTKSSPQSSQSHFHVLIRIHFSMNFICILSLIIVKPSVLLLMMLSNNNLFEFIDKLKPS
jgi:hypothetical protein